MLEYLSQKLYNICDMERRSIHARNKLYESNL